MGFLWHYLLKHHTTYFFILDAYCRLHKRIWQKRKGGPLYGPCCSWAVCRMRYASVSRTSFQFPVSTNSICSPTVPLEAMSSGSEWRTSWTRPHLWSVFNLSSFKVHTSRTYISTISISSEEFPLKSCTVSFTTTNYRRKRASRFVSSIGLV